jgi:RNA polymerase sigma factor (sigma-70 family)
MDPKSDAQLLREFAEHAADSLFGEIVARHAGLVYSAALRQTNSPELARDVAQNVFIDLARKARQVSERMSENGSLAGWLYRATQFAARNSLRGEIRRQTRERQAMEQFLPSPDGNPEWRQIGPALDDAMAGLPDADREALVLRFFKNLDLRSVGIALGVNDDTAQKRVSRALEKLRAHLARRGVKTTAGALSVVIAANAVEAAPAGLISAISTAVALVGTTLTTATAATATKAIAMTTFQKTIIGATLAIAAGTGIYQARQATDLRAQLVAVSQQQAPLAEQIQQLQRERDDALRQLAVLPPGRAPRLPAPAMQPGTANLTSDPASENLPATNRMVGLLNGDWPKLTPEQIDTYLRDNKRNAASLLAIFRATGDQALLKEALEKYPEDARVNFAAAFKPDSSPEERRRILDAFKQTAPENAMANYLSALDYFKTGRTDQAVQELTASIGKPGFQDYSWDFVQNAEEAWRSAGYSEAETKMVATWKLELPQLAPLKQLNQNILDLANSYRQSGDTASAQAALQIDLALGQRMSATQNDPLVNQLVGIAIQRLALGAMDLNAPYDGTGLTVKDRLDQLVQRKNEIQGFVKQAAPLQQGMTPQDWITYNDRTRSVGEESAIRWLVEKYGAK